MTYPYAAATPEQRALGWTWWAIHHQKKHEPLTEPIEHRVRCIQTEKPERERETRLRAMRPASPAAHAALTAAEAEYQRARGLALTEYQRVGGTALAEYKYKRVCGTAWAEYERVGAEWFARECPDVAWDANGLVFPAVPA